MPGKSIPRKHTADGEDVSPPLKWSGLPDGTRSLALIVEDPDAPRAEPWIHWVIYHIPADAPGLPENVPPQPTLATPAGAMQGKNDFGRLGYGGPAPPRGHGVHHYHFRLYALADPLHVAPGLDVKSLRGAMAGHVLAEAELLGTYERQ